MKKLWQAWREYGSKALPDQIAMQVLKLQTAHLNIYVPFLYITLTFSIISCIYAQTRAEDDLTYLIIPVIIAIVSTIRTIRWFRCRNEAFDREKAVKTIRNMAIISASIGILCGLWSFIAWQIETGNFRYYIPAFLAVGSFATAYCLSLVPRAAIFNLSVGALPISCALLLSGIQINMALGATIIASMLFLISLINKQYRQMVQMIDMQLQMQEMAHTDSLTGLLNRRAFHETFQRNLKSVPSCNVPITLVMIDLDGFKRINDCYGHLAGDEVLQEVAKRMQDKLGEFGQVARLGGDEFAILFDGHSVIFCNQLVEAFMADLAKPFSGEEFMLTLGASYGIVSFSVGDGNDELSLMAAADRLLYEMKNQRKLSAMQSVQHADSNEGRSAA